MNSVTRACAAAALLLAACADKPESVIEPQMSTLTTGTMRVTLNGPDGTSLCNTLPASAQVRIRVIDRVPVNDVQIRGKTVVCPVNTDTFVNLAFGPDYLLQAVLVTPGGSEVRIPISYVTPNSTAFSSTGGKVIRVLYGGRLGGAATVEGRNAPGVQVDLQPTISNYAGLRTTFTSDSKGVWKTSQGEPAFLQRGLSYVAQCKPGLGLATPPGPVGPFAFNTESSDVTCALQNSPSSRWTHSATSLRFTAWDGQWGWSVEGADPIGFGWGVQYPIAGTTRPSRLTTGSHSFRGGLIFSVDNSLVSAMDLEGLNLACGTTCRDMSAGVLATAKVGVSGKRITWDMSDAGFTDGRGLSIKQVSYDGEGGDFILYKVELRNNNTVPMTVYAGLFNNWDIWGPHGATPESNVGGLYNNISYVVDQDIGPEYGPYLGTVFLGNYATRGHRFINSETPTLSLANQVQTLQGGFYNTNMSSSDVRGFQSVGPIRIAAGGKKAVWFAVLAGPGLFELNQHATAANSQYLALTGP
jgi:hypothetical protein